MRCLLLFCLLLSLRVQAEINIDSKHLYYVVSAESPAEILKSLNGASPVRHNNKVFHAYTDSKLKWRFWWDNKIASCYIIKVKVWADISITLPKLEQSSEAVDSVWKSWYSRLLKHENGYKKHAIATAHKIEQAIYALAPQSNCKKLEQKANNLAMQLTHEISQLDKEYDLNANQPQHGEAE